MNIHTIRRSLLSATVATLLTLSLATAQGQSEASALSAPPTARVPR